MTGDQPPKPSEKVSLLRNRGFILLWCAYGVSAVGDHLSEMALLKTRNVLDAGVDITPLMARMTFAFFIPFFLLGPIAGILADRLPRRGLMVAADVARCAIMFSFAAIIGWTQDWGAWGLFAPLVLVGVFAAMFSPARAAMLPTLIRPDQLVRANGMISGLGIIATMAASLLGGYLASKYHPTVAFRLDAGTFAVTAVLLLFIRIPKHVRVERNRASLRSAIGDLTSGFSYVWGHRRVLQLLLIAALVWGGGAIVNSVIPAIVRDVYHREYQAMSGYRAFLGLGFIIGATGMAILGNALRSELAITMGLMGIGVSIAVFAASTFLPFSPNVLFVIGALGVVGAGAFGVAVMASFNSLLQRIVPDRLRGRVFGIKDLVVTSALLTTTGLLGIPHWSALDRWVGLLLLVVAAATFTAGAVTLWIRLGRTGMYGKWAATLWYTSELLNRFWYRFQRIGPCTVPRTGPVIVTANHTCAVDPLIIAAGINFRSISYMVAAEYTTWPIFGPAMRIQECIPVRRDGNDTAATKQTVRQLKAGKLVGIFIEGRIVPPGEQGVPKDGVATLARMTGATVIPAHIGGVIHQTHIVKGLFARHKASVRFGPPVDLTDAFANKDKRQAIRDATQKIYAAIQALTPSDNGAHPESIGRLDQDALTTKSHTSSETETPHEPG